VSEEPQTGYTELDLAWPAEKQQAGDALVSAFVELRKNLAHSSGGIGFGLRDAQIEVTDANLEDARKYQRELRNLFRQAEIKLEYCTVNVHWIEDGDEEDA
jgi:hypothetical protein